STVAANDLFDAGAAGANSFLALPPEPQAAPSQKCEHHEPQDEPRPPGEPPLALLLGITSIIAQQRFGLARTGTFTLATLRCDPFLARNGGYKIGLRSAQRGLRNGWLGY